MNSKSIALYIRLSSEDKAHDGDSIENQKRQLRNHLSTYLLEYQGYEVIEFVDDGYSGTNFERPAISEIFERIKNHEIEAILVKDFSRLGRDLLQIGYFLEKIFPIYEVRFISLNDNYDSKLAYGVGDLEYTFRYLNHEYYSRDLSKKVKASIHTKMREGKYVSMNAVYGYLREGEQLVIDEVAAEVIRLIFRLKDENTSTSMIQKILFEQKKPTPSEHKFLTGRNYFHTEEVRYIWDASIIRKIINDERYMGVYIGGTHILKEVCGKCYKERDRSKWYIVPNALPQIITKELFDSVQSKKRIRRTQVADGSKSNKQGKKETYAKRKEKYLLRPYLYCGYCGKNMAIAQRNEAYKCSLHKILVEQDCHLLHIPRDMLHDMVWKEIQTTAMKVKINRIKTKGEVGQGDSFVAERRSQQKALFEQMIKEEISSKEFEERNFEIELDIVRFKEMTDNAVKSPIVTTNVAEVNCSQIDRLIERIEESEELTGELAELLIDKVLIYKNYEISLIFREKTFEKNK